MKYIQYTAMKPDLIVHPMYSNVVLQQYQLEAFYNIVLLEDLKILTDDGEGAALVANEKSCVPVSITLTPFYENRKLKSGGRPHVTSYHFHETLPLYRVAQRAPRYVIWTETDPLTVCATYVDRVSFSELYGAVCRARQWSYEISADSSIVVFDLDRTLIDDKSNILPGALCALANARKSYDYVVLWSHGSPLHVDESVSRIKSATRDDALLFDLVLCNEFYDEISNKNLLYLYNFFTDCVFSRATLVDDSVYNWTPEYDRIIVPRAGTLIPALPFI